ncbi:hypothetical protein RAM_02760 [Amycolatopsis mediterranei S699]|uniref:Uncharacterized protein n=1 Tax=Amycolatopsis mediterranei (strain S699) TaxID=713604 RepID=A0A9R0U5Z1_AMYMS|nr:hypothetical protein RAM_02760 [Amycolatopsis mediterranei S699]
MQYRKAVTLAFTAKLSLGAPPPGRGIAEPGPNGPGGTESPAA